MKITVVEPLGITEEQARECTADFQKRGWELSLPRTRPENSRVLQERLMDADVAVIADLPLPEETVRNCPRLKMISVAFTGVDHIAVSQCRKQGIAVSNSAGYSNESVSELVIGMALSLYRSLPECDHAVRTGRTRSGLTGRELCGKKFGILGTGAIGKKTALLARAFGCEVLGYSRKKEEGPFQWVPLDTLLSESDILSLHVPLTGETRGMIGTDALKKMKPSAILINAARGPVVDAEALARALKEGQLAGAGIDVFDTEPPLAPDHPLLSCPHVILSPHIGFATEEAMVRRARIVFENIRRWADGCQQNTVC